MAIFSRVLLKLSGEALMGDQATGIDPATLAQFANDVASVAKGGVQVAVVVGGGNIFRGVAGATAGIERGTGDAIGMLATVMNALALRAALEDAGAEATVMSALAMPTICESFNRHAALAHLNAGRVVVFAAGTGNPYFTTDTAAALRAAEMKCDVLLKATQVDGVYSADPKSNPDAVRFERLTVSEAIEKDLKVMDIAAFALARESKIPLIVFDVHTPDSLRQVLNGEGRFTRVEPDPA